MSGAQEYTFPELFTKAFPAVRGDLVHIDVSSDAEARRLEREPVQVQLSGGIRIPRLQRDYAQGRDDGPAGRVTRVRREFLQALLEAVTDPATPLSLGFMYGQFERPRQHAARFEAGLLPLDGQQRLTTLFLLHWYASRRDGHVGDAAFLNGFSYETRYSSAAFCSFLCDIPSLHPPPDEAEHLRRKGFDIAADGIPRGEGSIRAMLSNRPQFVDAWRKDPTVSGMLVMLDAIHGAFVDVPDLWNVLTGPGRPLRFHFRTVGTIGVDPDEVFIKMNSRGLELTEFEYFKADLLQFLEDHRWDEAQLTELGTRIDRDWESAFWNMAEHCDLDAQHLDPYLMRVVNFLIDMIGYRDQRIGKGKTFDRPNPNPERYDPDRVREVLVPNGALDGPAVDFLIAAFDNWTGDKIGPFFERVFRQAGPLTVLDDRVALWRRRDGVQLLADCASGQTLSVPDRALLFAVLSWRVDQMRQRRPRTPDPMVNARLRAIRNIASNMDNSNETLHLWLNGFPRVLAGEHVQGSFGLEGVARPIPEAIVAEENLKLSLAESADARLEALHRLEEHDWLRGRINVLCPDIVDPDANPDTAGEVLLDRATRLGPALNRLSRAMTTGLDHSLRLALLLAIDCGTYTIRTRANKEYWGTTKGGVTDGRWQELFRRPDGHRFPGNSAALIGVLEALTSAGEVEVVDWLPTFVEERHATAITTATGYDLRFYLLQYPETMLNFAGWPDDPLVRQKVPSGLATNWNRGDRMAYLVSTAGNWFWDPFLLTVLHHVDPEDSHGIDRRWRGSDHSARFATVPQAQARVCCRAPGYFVIAEGEEAPIEGLVLPEELPWDVKPKDGQTVWLWPVAGEGEVDTEDRVARGITLFSRLLHR